MVDDNSRQPTGAAPSKPGQRRGHRGLPRTVGIVLITVTVLAAGCGMASAGVAGADGPAGEAGQSPRPAPTATPPQAAGTPGPLTPDGQLNLIGFGPIEFGMTVEEAERAGGVALLPWADEYYPDCWYVVPEGWPRVNSEETGSTLPPVSFMVIDGNIARVDVLAGSAATPEGIRIGSTEQDVHKAYPDQVTATTDRPGHRLLIYVPPTFVQENAARDGFVFYTVIVFESDGHQVTGMRAGWLDEAVTADEGCA